MNRWYTAFDYDFNDPDGKVVISKDLHAEENLLGKEILLVSIEGDRRTGSDYDGFGTIVRVLDTTVVEATGRVILHTDLPERWPH